MSEADDLDAELSRALGDSFELLQPLPPRNWGHARSAAFTSHVREHANTQNLTVQVEARLRPAKRSRTATALSAKPSVPDQHLVPLRTGVFAGLPDDLAAQVLACSSAADLTAVAQTSRFFRALAGENGLWRPLYLFRWGDNVEDSNKLQDSVGWKEKYMERDAQDVAEVKERVPSSLQDLYLQMSTAKRTRSLPRRKVVAPLSDVALKGRISRWRGARGILRCPCPELGGAHAGCRKKGPYSMLPGSLFMCESCGWAHMCGEGCTERFLDHQAQQLVCPVSGRCFDVIAEDSYEEGREGQEDYGTHDFGVAGHWGRAYADGYNCNSEEELKTHCGAFI